MYQSIFVLFILVTLTADKLELLVRELTIGDTSGIEFVRLGNQLSIPGPRLHFLAKRLVDTPRTAWFYEMCYQWLYNDEVEGRKWSEVYKALEHLGNRRQLKANLEKKYAADTRGNSVKNSVTFTPKE